MLLSNLTQAIRIQGANGESFRISSSDKCQVLDHLDFRIEELKLLEGRVIATVRLTYLGHPARSQCPERDFVEVNVNNGRLPWSGVPSFKIDGIPEDLVRREIEYGCFFRVDRVTQLQRLFPNESIRYEIDISQFFKPEVVSSQFDMIVKHQNKYTLQGVVEIYDEEGVVSGLARTHSSSLNRNTPKNAKVFDLRTEWAQLAQRVDTLGIPVSRDFKLQIDRLEYSIGRVYAIVSLNYLGNSNRSHCEIHSLDIPQRQAHWDQQPSYLVSVSNIPKPFRKRERYVDGLASLWQPKPFLGRGRMPYATNIEGSQCSMTFNIELTEHIDLGKAYRNFNELAIRRGEIQLQCFVSYRCGDEMKSGLVSTH